MNVVSPTLMQSLTAAQPAVRAALRAAAQALTGGAAAATADAQGHWQTAHAALQGTDHRALVKFSSELGALLAAADGEVKGDRATAFGAGSEALLAYIDALIAGRRDQPLRLFAAYETVQKARGVAQPGKSDLFFPDLNVTPPERMPGAPLGADELRSTRRQLEGALLQWMRKADHAGLQPISAAVERVEAAQQDAPARRLWWVARGVLEAVLHDGLAVDALVRRLLMQLNLHLGRLVQGPAETPEALLRDALYLAASAKPVTPLIDEVQQVCGLRGALDTETEVAPAPAPAATPAAESTPSPEAALAVEAPAAAAALAPMAAPAGFTAETLAAARSQAAGLQDLWSACASGSADFAAFEPRARALAGACVALGDSALTAVVTQLAATATRIAASPTAAREAPVLEGACALLMIDHALAADQAPDGGFAPRAHNMVARLKASVDTPLALAALPPAQWLDEAAQKAQAQEQDVQVRTEIERDLRDIERVLEGWSGEADHAPSLAGLDKPWRRVCGAFSMLGHGDAAVLAGQCRDQLARHAQGAASSAEERQHLTRRVRALSAFAAASKLGPAQLERIAAVAAPAQPVAAPLELAPVAELPALVDLPPVVQAQPAAALAPAAVRETAAAPIDGAGDTDPEMLEIFLDEACEVLQTVVDTAPQSRAQPQDQELLTILRRGFHTLKGSGRMVGLKHLGEAAWELEQVFNERSAQQQPGTPDLYRLVDAAHAKFAQWIDELRAYKQTAIDAAQLNDWARRLRAGEPLPAETATAVVPEPSLPVIEPPAPPAPSATVQVGDVTMSRSLYEIMVPEARQTLIVMDEQNRRLQEGATVTPDLVRAVHTLSGISGTAGVTAIRTLGASLERVLDGAVDGGGVLPAAAGPLIASAIAALHEQVAAVAELKAPAAHAGLVAALDSVVVEPVAPPPSREPPPAVVDTPPAVAAVALPALMPVQSVPPPAFMSAPQPAPAFAPVPAPVSPATETKEGERRRYRLNDDIDQQLLPIFLEEAAELVPQVGQDLRAWRARPDDKLVAQSLKRLLHTLKGSARMAGAMALGQLTHGMESRIENAQRLPAIPTNLIDELENSFDRIGALIAELQQTEPPASAVEPAALTQAMVQMSRTMQLATASGAMTQLLPVQYADGDAAAGQAQGLPRPLLRVRADLIDRLVNQAGEVSIARARVSAELSSARGSLRELTENVSRLRAQLRELEIAAEMQMQSRFSPAPEQTGGQFDPLEFDRFTRLQELTRLMAESVNDVATVQHSLARDLDEGEKALAAQAQTTRDVQQDLMAIRMVPFASISDRLYRVTRLSAKDAEKRVGLDIVGEQVEVDRGVMDRIAAPIEHLLRNAIVHGIEAPQRRLEIGKPEAGALKLEVRQEGNEVVLTLADDGDGLNLARIREKALALGMMREDDPLADQQIANFIFRSGFSTANAVTAEAGRGVGMDVVMAEVTALGGRVTTHTERGKGTQFTIHLPLTLSVLQAVVMRVAGNAYAVPTMMVEQVQRLKAEVLAAAHGARKIEWQDAVYPFHHLAQLLEMEAPAEAAPYGTVILLRGGAGRAAIQVDDIVGGQEIVIKNIGPQLARVPGVTGAAVLGSGETVLILNPLALTARHLEVSAAAAQAQKPVSPAGQPAAPAEPERQRSVLVVDDSLTVRKITDRLLTREGYRVVVAKDGVEALEKLRDQLPDVVITDVEMPRMDGFDLVRNVRADDHLKGLPVIMITSRTAEKHRQHASEIGVDVFLGKPYEEGELLGHIATLARR